MAVNPGVWGIDIGQCALKAIRLEQINGVITATAFDYVEHPKILSQPDANPDELTREALEKFLSRNPTKGDQIAMSVPGQSGLARFVKLPPVEEKKIIDIVRFEAKQQIPFPLEEVVWDYQKVSEGTVTDGFAMDTEIGLFAMKRDMISRYIGHFQSVKLEVHQVQMTPLALVNYVTYDLLKRGGIDGEAAPAVAGGKKRCVVALDIGTDSSNLIITDGARIIWQRPIPVGGNHFTRALTKELKLTFAKAEHLKRNAAKSPELATILKALRPVLQEFVGEVQRSLGYFTNTHRDAQIDYMVGMGSAFKLPGMQKFLADKLNLDVRKVDKLQRLTGPAVTDAPVFKENILSFPVAYGLALQGLGMARLTTNLLPPEISFERQIRAKKPYAVAAAAALLLGTTVLAYGYSVPLAHVNDPVIKTSLDKAKSVISAASSVDRQINEKMEEVAKTQTEVESIIAGQAERMNWLTLNQFINSCLPVPGPAQEKQAPIPGYHNMLGPQLEPYWATTNGRRAIIKLEERIGKGIDPLQAMTDDDLREHLAMIDIERIDARFTTNLKAFYEAIELKRRKEINSPRSFPGSDYNPKDWWENKPDRPVPPAPPTSVREELKPEGEGWVIEVTGYTYWHPEQTSLTDKFIMDTLLRNIITRSLAGQEPRSEEEKRERAEHPIVGKISHVFLYNVWEDKNPAPGVLVNIKSSLLDELLAAADSAGSAAGGGEQGGVPGAGTQAGLTGLGGLGGAGGDTGGASAAVAWRPLGSLGGASSFTGGGAPGGSGSSFGTGSTGSGLSLPSGPPTGKGPVGGVPGSGTPTGATGTGGSSPATPRGVKIKSRYEFSLMFVWKEPTPSDKLRPIKIKEAPAVSGPGMPSGPTGPSMPAGPSGPAPGGGSGGGTLGGGRRGSIDID